ncbi:MAG TPA: response regulator [Terriglobales bacterium]|nr:response regulator [Terriglobales bacterium]
MRPKVLVVDDEIVIANTLGLILRQEGYDSQVAYSGQAALQQSLEFQPALLISDVVMPDLNGIEVALRVREFLPNCQVLLLSGQAATADLLLAARAGGHEFPLLSKPVHPEELLRQVARRLKSGPTPLV